MLGIQHAYAKKRRPGQAKQTTSTSVPPRSSFQIRPGGQQQCTAVADERHRSPKYPVPGVERAADAPQYHQAHCQHHDRTDGAQVIAGQVKGKAEPPAPKIPVKIRYAAGTLARNTLEINRPRTRSWFGSSARKNAGVPMVAGAEQRQLQRQNG